MRLVTLDWLVIVGYGLLSLAVGLAYARRAGRGMQEFFLSGRSLPWWLLGTSMVATTFSTDTPNLVTDIVRTGGVRGNWVWWAFLLTGMLTVFFYAKLWRRSQVFTDMGFYELRYSGRPAAFLRGFRAVYLGVFFNVMIMASVTLAAIKIGGVLLGLDKHVIVIAAAGVTMIYAVSSGLWGVIVTDFLQFIIAMIGAFAAAFFALDHPAVGGLSGLLSHEAVTSRLAFLPDFGDWRTATAAFVIPIAVQWWSTWYPGAEPGGGGYVAQRMLAAKDERHAMKATLWFNIAHYALRPWPWVIVALASLIVYPDLASIATAFPHLDPQIVRNDLGYPAMLVFLPSGMLGLMVASLAAAYMSTIATHLNWGSSYVVDDCYRRFVRPDADDRHYVTVGRISTVVLVIAAAAVSLWLESALQTFNILLQIGAGTGLVFLLRWFWWRVNAWAEWTALVVGMAIAIALTTVPGLAGLSFGAKIAITTFGTMAAWIPVMFLTPPESPERLDAFYRRARPGGPGWRVVRERTGVEPGSRLSRDLLQGAAVLAMVVGLMLGIGGIVVGSVAWAMGGFGGAVAGYAMQRPDGS